MNDYAAYVRAALEAGADKAEVFGIDDIVFDPRTVLKCRFGCDNYGKHYFCPTDPRMKDIEQSIRIFRHYKGGIIIRTEDKHSAQQISLAIERQAMRDGRYMALSLSSCDLCKTCACETDRPCPHKSDARPAFHTVGVDVVSTVAKMGMTMKEEKDGKTVYYWFSAVFID